MKNWLNKYFMLFIASLALMSCEKDEEQIIIGTGTAPELSASATTLVLEEENSADEALTLNWSASEFGYQAAVSYTLQADMKGNNFASPVEAAIGNATEKTFTVAELNTLVNRLPITAFRENEVEIRIKASVSDKVAPAYSNVTTLNVTPYLTEPPYATLYMIGDATDADWNNANAIAMLRDPNDLFKFTFTGNFKAGNLKFLGQRGSWAPMYGGANNTLVFRETEGDPDPASIQMTAGYKTVTVDLRNNTYSVTPYDASAKPTYSALAIIGSFSANPWNTDVLMNSTATNPHYWTLEHTFATDVEMKIRKAGDWGTNWGAPKDQETSLFNKAGGENMKIAAGTYLIVFNDLTGNYIFIKKP